MRRSFSKSFHIFQFLAGTYKQGSILFHTRVCKLPYSLKGIKKTPSLYTDQNHIFQGGGFLSRIFWGFPDPFKTSSKYTFLSVFYPFQNTFALWAGKMMTLATKTHVFIIFVGEASACQMMSSFYHFFLFIAQAM